MLSMVGLMLGPPGTAAPAGSSLVAVLQKSESAAAKEYELTEEEQEAEGEEGFELPEGVEPFLQETELYGSHTAAGIALLWAPRPFSLRSGRMRRSVDVPLLNNWFHEHVPQVQHLPSGACCPQRPYTCCRRC